MRNVKRTICVLLTLAVIFTTCCIVSGAVSDNCKKIYEFLTNDMGLNSAAACGVLANIEEESGFEPNLGGDGGSSYGICQWHAERFTNLQNFCSRNGYSWKSLDGQLNFLKYELTNYECDTGYILEKLKDVSDTAQGAYKAGYDWCYYFERPAYKDSKSESRGASARDEYWPVFGKKYVSTGTALGDVTGDGRIDSSDALLIVQSSVGKKTLNAAQKKAADVNGDNRITASDALIILDISTGKDSIGNYR